MTPKIPDDIRDAVTGLHGGPVELPDTNDTVYVVMTRQKFQLLVHDESPSQSTTAGSQSDEADIGWTEEVDSRRCELIDRDIAGTISDEELSELDRLQQLANAHYDQLAPPPVNGARRLHHQLLVLKNRE